MYYADDIIAAVGLVLAARAAVASFTAISFSTVFELFVLASSCDPWETQDYCLLLL